MKHIVGRNILGKYQPLLERHTSNDIAEFIDIYDFPNVDGAVKCVRLCPDIDSWAGLQYCNIDSVDGVNNFYDSIPFAKFNVITISAWVKTSGNAYLYFQTVCRSGDSTTMHIFPEKYTTDGWQRIHYTFTSDSLFEEVQKRNENPACSKENTMLAGFRFYARPTDKNEADDGEVLVAFPKVEMNNYGTYTSPIEDNCYEFIKPNIVDDTSTQWSKWITPANKFNICQTIYLFNGDMLNNCDSYFEFEVEGYEFDVEKYLEEYDSTIMYNGIQFSLELVINYSLSNEGREYMGCFPPGVYRYDYTRLKDGKYSISCRNINAYRSGRTDLTNALYIRTDYWKSGRFRYRLAGLKEHPTNNILWTKSDNDAAKPNLIRKIITNNSNGTGVWEDIEIHDAPNPYITAGLHVIKTSEDGNWAPYASEQYMTLMGGRTYTMSAYVRGTGSMSLLFWCSDSTLVKNNRITITNEWKRHELTYTIPEGWDGKFSVHWLSGYNSDYEICGMKVEENHKATAWRPYMSEVILDEKECYKNDIRGTVNSVIVNKTIHKGYNSLVFPFSLTSAQIKEAFGELSKVLVLQNISDPGFYSLFQDNIEANQPFILYSETEGKTWRFENVFFSIDDPVYEHGGAQSVGTYRGEKVFPDNDTYNIYVMQNDGRLVKADQRIVLDCMSAYFVKGNYNYARKMTIPDYYLSIKDIDITDGPLENIKTGYEIEYHVPNEGSIGYINWGNYDELSGWVTLSFWARSSVENIVRCGNDQWWQETPRMHTRNFNMLSVNLPDDNVWRRYSHTMFIDPAVKDEYEFESETMVDNVPYVIYCLNQANMTGKPFQICGIKIERGKRVTAYTQFRS